MSKRKPRKEDGLDLLMIAIMGGDSDQAVRDQEAAGQRSLVESETLPIEIRGKKLLEDAGVKFLGQVEGDPLFQYVELPEGWSVEPTNRSMWSKLVDEKGRERASIFYKAASYDRRAHAQAIEV